MKLTLHDTYSGTKTPFEPLEPGVVRMYNCGPTVYDYAHIGNFRSFLLADTLRRTLEKAGYDVQQIMNITDVGHLTEDDAAEDKIAVGVRREQLDPFALTRRYTEAFLEDARLLGLREAERYPRATDHIPQMIALIERLFETGHAYQTESGVYYDVSRFERYGQLSGNTLEALQAGSRVDVRDDKRSPFDFALWKHDDKHLMKWDSPWGVGFPGWHLECSAMAGEYLGETLDIHTGGEDNAFPHHECEIAQTEAATGKPFARFWLHARYLLVDGRKMSKSQGNFYTVRDLVAEGYEGREIRHALLGAHYRHPLNFTREGLDGSRTALAKLEHLLRRLRRPESDTDDAALPAELAARQQAFWTAMADDLNVPQAFGVLFELVADVNRRASLGPGDAAAVEAALRDMDQATGVLPAAEELAEGAPAEIVALAEQRTAARAAKDWAAADRIRDELAAAGWVVEDRASGAELRRI